MTSATIGSSINQVLLSPSGGMHRDPTTSLVGISVDGEDQTAAGELTWGKGPLRVSTGMEVNMLDKQKGLETSPAQKRLPQTYMVTPRISQHIPINETHLEYINFDLDAIKGIKNTRPLIGGSWETFVSTTMNHRNQGESPSTKVYECIQNSTSTFTRQTPWQKLILCTTKRKRMLTTLSQLLSLSPSPPICLIFAIICRSATHTP
jgi:hypothetical protein